MGFHSRCKSHQCLSRHQAVRIKNHHMIVLAAPALAEIRNIARFAPGVLTTMPIKNARLAAGTTAQLQEMLLFFEPYIWISRVTEHKEGERLERTNGFKGFIHSLQACK